MASRMEAAGGLTELAEDWVDYTIDAAQRLVLVTDILRQRGNQYVEHVVLGHPPVLTFDYDLVMDGRHLPRPCNYQLLRIRPAPDRPTDPDKRPIVVIDPRAGHGPGIGGFKPDSQIGLALRHGHPCYFVSFLPLPEPGQTVEDVARAEGAFLAEVIARHPQAEDRPVVIGNCQAGWAVAILGAVAPDLMSVVILNGAPLSYWSGEIGRNPMRYLGGLLGGSWLAALASDLGNGRFDGANLVSNFEFLDPANTVWKKPYNLYANVDTEGPRFLEFERWWGGHFLLNKAEIGAIVEDLFIGNRLAGGEIAGSGGRHVELRAITAPIVVFCSKGDNVTPPQQALNWIMEVYEDVDDMRANGQVIVYLLHESIGHLGIFVSSKVAKREHHAIIDNLDVVSTLPPGLYEMRVGRVDGDDWEVHFARRDFADLRALGGTRREEAYFLPVARVSAFNRMLYDAYLSPWARAVGREPVAEMLRRTNGHRVRRYVWSDVNPAMAGFGALADETRRWRRAAGADNLFRRAERHTGDLIVAWLDHFRDWRDRAFEGIFYAAYMPLCAVMLKDRQAIEAANAARRARRHREAADQLARRVRHRLDEGGVAEAVLRVLLYLTRRRPHLDSGRFRLVEAALSRCPHFAGLDSRTMRRMLREQFQALMIDEAAAIAALGRMAQSAEDRRDAIAIIDDVAAEMENADPAQREDLDHIRRILSVPAGMAPAPAARRGRPKSDEAPPLH